MEVVLLGSELWVRLGLIESTVREVVLLGSELWVRLGLIESTVSLVSEGDPVDVAGETGEVACEAVVDATVAGVVWELTSCAGALADSMGAALQYERNC